jgi:hypothetical protein
VVIGVDQRKATQQQSILPHPATVQQHLSSTTSEGCKRLPPSITYVQIFPKNNDMVVKGYVVALLAQLCCGVHIESPDESSPNLP